MRIPRGLIALAATAAMLLPVVVGAQSPPKTNAKGAGAGVDRTFITKAANGNRAEIELGKLAGERASSEGVKEFGQRMVTDHGKAYDEIKELAERKGMTLPADLDAKHRKLQDRLSALSGPAFDRAYVDEMVKDHRQDVADFQRQATTGKDPEVRNWASQTLPTLQDHLKQVQALQAQLKGKPAAAR
jgi:putative membrane protein